ncbi:MAG: retroviral-like aspartic protease family protein [Prevotellaceae bacterium]|jgi:hypothetical protein|nr:retroviral-like aspartic protease family protein [Prevotellaceae bacterium]
MCNKCVKNREVNSTGNQEFTWLGMIFAHTHDYLDAFDAKINLVDELVSPKTETDELKKITKGLYLTMDSLLDPIAKYQDAHGKTVMHKRVILNNVKIGDFTLNNVIFAIANDDSAGFLLGKDILNAFQSCIINNATNTLELIRKIDTK